MTINISNYRISFFQIETFDGLISREAPYGFLARPDQYEHVFRDEENKAKIILPMHSINFWKNYLKTKKIEEANPKEVVQRLFPVFKPSIMKPELLSTVNGRAIINGYCWPHCLACELKLFIEDEQSLESAVDQVMAFRYNPVYSIDKDNPSGIHLSVLFNDAICKIRKYFTGTEDKAGESGQLFSIVSFINGSGEDKDFEISANSLLHKALIGLCKWKRNWNRINYNSIDQNLISIDQEATPVHAICHSRHDRVVWFPSNFQMEGVRINGCYQNNLSTLSLQIESLGAMVEMASEKYANGVLVEDSFDKYSKYAAINLSLLYGGNKKTYRSIIAQKQITDSQFIDPINFVRDHLGIAGPDLV